MRQNNFGRAVIVVLIVLWSLYEIYPPTSRDLVKEFESRARNRDAAFANILQSLQPLQQKRPEREFANLQEAIGTNDIKPYFPFVNAKNNAYPTVFILNRLQRDASGPDQTRARFAGGHVVPVGNGHQQPGLC